MAKRLPRSQLNQIRAWVREGRTDAWIAHQLDVPAAELKDFRRKHGLAPAGEEPTEADLRDEIEAEIEAATREAEVVEEEEEEAPVEGTAVAAGAEATAGEEAQEAPAEGGRRRRRRRRRGRRGKSAALQATFDHGETDGFGLWLDPAIQDDATYSEHWAGHRAVEVQVEPDRIVIRRTES